MIRRLFRLCFRLGLLTGIGLALFKVLKGRRSAAEFGSPSADWAPPPVPNPNLPRTPPEPELIEPVMFEEIIEKKAAIRAVPDPVPAAEPGPAPEAPTAVTPEPAVVTKAAPAKKAPAKKAAAPAAAGPVKKVVPKKAPAKKVATPADAPVAKKVTPAKKAPKKTQ